MVVNPFRPNPGINDAWYNPRISGQDILFTYFPEVVKLFGAWCTFDTERPPEDI